MHLLYGDLLPNTIDLKCNDCRTGLHVGPIITGEFDYIHVRGIAIVKNLKWMNVIQRRDYFVALSMFKCIHEMSPSYLSDCITIYNEIAVRDTRASTFSNLVTVSHAPLALFENSFAYRALLYGRHCLNMLESAIVYIRLRKLYEHMFVMT